MSRTLIYLIAVFALWMYFSFSSAANGKTMAEKYDVEDFDNARSGSGGTATVSNKSVFKRGNGFSNTGTWKSGGGFGSTV